MDSTLRYALQSARSSARHARQTASVGPWPCPTPTASSANLKTRAPLHTADLAPNIFEDGTRFWCPQKCAAGALFLQRKNQMKFKKQFSRRRRTYIRVPKTDYCTWFSAVRDPDRWSRTSERHSKPRPGPQTTSTPLQPCPTPTASSATLDISGRSHTADLALIILGDF